MGTKLVFPIPKEVIEICNVLQKAGHQAYLVGGAIRDLLRFPGEAEVAKDFDIGTSARPEEVTRIFGRTRTIPTGLKHGTVTVLLPPTEGRARTKRDHIEVTTFRKEGHYNDGRRPEQIAFLEDLTQDLQRRDFTMNAIAYNPTTEEIIDPFSGSKDIENRLIRAVGNPLERFSEDGLRALRALRFAAQLGFQIEFHTFAAIPLALETFRKVSKERIRDEFVKLLSGSHVEQGLSLLSQSGLLFEIIPALSSVLDSPQQKRTFLWIALLPRDPILRLSALLFSLQQLPIHREVLQQIFGQLKLSSHEQARLTSIFTAPSIDIKHVWTSTEIRKFLSQTTTQAREDIFSLKKTFLMSEPTDEARQSLQLWTQFEKNLREELGKNPPLSINDLAIDGSEIMKILGLPPGKQIGTILKKLFEQILTDPTLNTKEQLHHILLHEQIS